MYAGKTLFAQLMDFLPWTTFTRIVSRYGGASARFRTPNPMVTSQHDRARRVIPDYQAGPVSKQVVRVVLSYTDYINRTVWSKV